MNGKAFVVMDDVEKEAQYQLRVADSLGVTTLGTLVANGGVSTEQLERGS